jgi:hypothetical protein
VHGAPTIVPEEQSLVHADREQDKSAITIGLQYSRHNPFNGSESALQTRKDNSFIQAENSSFCMYPDLHDEISKQLEANGLSVEFYGEGQREDTIRDSDTRISGTFTCPNQSCSVEGWSSGIVAISIQLFKHGRYNALVWHQRCRDCEAVGRLEVDVQAYTNRVVYRLGKWLGLKVAAPPYSGNILLDGPHRDELCEGCKNGHCKESRYLETSMA